MRRIWLSVGAVVFAGWIAASGAGCRSNSEPGDLASAATAERGSAFRDIGKRSASDLTLE